MMKERYAPGDLNEARLRMAKTPRGATLITNPISWAPGFQIENVFVMAGVPKVMQAMLEGLHDRLEGSAPMLSRSLRAELPEGVLAGGLGVLQERYPGAEFGSYPFHEEGTFGARLVISTTDEAELAEAAAALEAMVRDLGKEGVWEG